MVASVKVTKFNGICNRYDRHFYDVFSDNQQAKI